MNHAYFTFRIRLKLASILLYCTRCFLVLLFTHMALFLLTGVAENKLKKIPCALSPYLPLVKSGIGSKGYCIALLLKILYLRLRISDSLVLFSAANKCYIKALIIVLWRIKYIGIVICITKHICSLNIKSSSRAKNSQICK